MNSASLLLQRADSYLYAYPLAQLGVYLAAWHITRPIQGRLPVIETVSDRLPLLIAPSSEVFKKISWIVPVGGAALCTFIAYTAYNATSSLLVKTLIKVVFLGITMQFIYGKNLSDPETLSLKSHFDKWSQLDRRKCSRNQDNFATIASFAVGYIFSRMACNKLRWHTIPATTATMIVALATRTLFLKATESFDM